MVKHYRQMPCADERNVPGALIINCVPSSGVNLARAATNGLIPATDAEVLALRKATGDLVGGEGLIELREGMRKRYGWTNLPIDNSYPAMYAGLRSNRWYAAIGWYSYLPERIKNAGQRDISHCVAIGPNTSDTAVLVDPLQKPYPKFVVVSFAEVHKFTASMGFLNLSIAEYSKILRHGHVSVGPGDFYAYQYKGGKWVRHKKHTGGFSADTTLAATYPNVYGTSKRMVKILTGFLSEAEPGYWLNTTGQNVTYTETEK